MNLDGKSAIVTGVGGGIGRAIALGMACAGARVAVADIDSRAAAETVSMIDASASSQSIAITADSGDVEQIDQVVATAVERFGRLDVMVNNAGVTRRACVMDLTEEDFDRINRVNFKGVFFGLQRAAREMIPRREGVIVNEVVWYGLDVHPYRNHLEQAKQLIARKPRPFPNLKIKRKASSLFDYRIEDLELEGYDPHAHIAAPIAV